MRHKEKRRADDIGNSDAAGFKLENVQSVNTGSENIRLVGCRSKNAVENEQIEFKIFVQMKELS